MTDYLRLPSGVVIPTEFAEAQARPEMNEVATIGNGRDITRGYVDGMPILPPEDSILVGRGGGDYKIYEEIKRDWQVKATFEQRRLAVVSKDYEVTPGDDNSRAEEAAEFISDQLARISFDRVTDKMLWGVFYGFAVAECMWAVEDSKVVLNGIRVRKQRRFGFNPEMQLRLKTLAQPFGEALPDRKFWTFSCGADNDDDPYGVGLAHWLYWPVFFKRNDIKFWLMFLEKWGQPTAKGTYPANAQKTERDRLLQALQAISTDAGIIVPEGMQIELIEAARSGTSDYAELHDRMDAAIAKVVLGHTGSSESTPGKLGGEDNAQEVRGDLIEADADLVCESFNQTVVRWLTDWNFGPDVAPPEVWRIVEEGDDLDKLSERDERLSTFGYRPTIKRVLEKYGPDYEPYNRPSDVPTTQPAEFSEGGRDIVDAQADKMDEVSEASFNKMMEPVRKLVNSAESLEQIRDGLAALYPDMDDAAFVELLRQAMTAANLAGRDDVKDGK